MDVGPSNGFISSWCFFKLVNVFWRCVTIGHIIIIFGLIILPGLRPLIADYPVSLEVGTLGLSLFVLGFALGRK
jgi:hypothetical protein